MVNNTGKWFHKCGIQSDKEFLNESSLPSSCQFIDTIIDRVLVNWLNLLASLWFKYYFEICPQQRGYQGFTTLKKKLIWPSLRSYKLQLSLIYGNSEQHKGAS